MLFHLLFPWKEIAAFNIFRYITFRASVAFLLAIVISVIWGKHFIAYMRRRQFGQVIRDDGPASHFKKAGTPTMGGVFIVGSVLATMAVCGNFFSLPLVTSLSVFVAYSFLGFADDYLKVLQGDSKGLSVKAKLFWQFSIAICVMYFLIDGGIVDTRIYAPFVKEYLFDAGGFYVLFGAVVIVGSSNAVNLTDGLDGLAIGPIMTSSATLALMAYVAGHTEISDYLYIPTSTASES